MELGFEFGMTVNLGNYSSMTFKVNGLNGNEVRATVLKEFDETLKTARECLFKASKN